MSSENKNPLPQATQPTPADIETQKLNRLSIKFNAAMTLNQEIGEAVSEFINAENAVINELKRENADLKAKIPAEQEKRIKDLEALVPKEVKAK